MNKTLIFKEKKDLCQSNRKSILGKVLSHLTAPWDLEIIDDGDHSFNMPKSIGTDPQAIYCRILKKILAWLGEWNVQRCGLWWESSLTPQKRKCKSPLILVDSIKWWGKPTTSAGIGRQAASTFKTKITRELAAEHGRQAIQITETGEYRSSSGRVVRIVEMVRRYVDETVSYLPDEPFQKSANGQHQAKITVENTTTYNLNTH